MENARALLEVTAGLIPGKPEPELTRQWAITSAQWQEALGKTNSDLETAATLELLATCQGLAQGYAQLLMLQPDRVNWVRTDWIWL
jgi:hypothetical protein